MTFRSFSWIDYCFQVGQGIVASETRCLPAGRENQALHFDTSSDQPTARGPTPKAGPPFATTGTVSQNFQVLGPVHYDTVGMVNLGSSLSDALFKSKFERAVQGATPDMRQARAFQELLNKAVQTYGSRVNAVINATYRAESDGDVFVDGIAIEFVGPVEETPATTRRLQELKELLEAGFVTPKEH